MNNLKKIHKAWHKYLSCKKKTIDRTLFTQTSEFSLPQCLHPTSQFKYCKTESNLPRNLRKDLEPTLKEAGKILKMNYLTKTSFSLRMMIEWKIVKKAKPKKQHLTKSKSKSSINLSGDSPTYMPSYKKEESLDHLGGTSGTNSMTPTLKPPPKS